MNKKSIDINQRIPLDILEIALNSYCKDNYSEEYILEQLSVDFSGENRIKKAVRIVNKIVSYSTIEEFIVSNKQLISSALKIKNERNIILISLLNAAFPFSYYTMRVLGTMFQAQGIISREALTRQLARVYGGNRATDNAIDSVIPMYLEAEFFTRPKMGIYEWTSPLVTSSSVSKKIFEESFKCNNLGDEIMDYQKLDPYFLFVE